MSEARMSENTKTENAVETSGEGEGIDVNASIASLADAESREILNLLGDQPEATGGSCCGGSCCA